MTDGAELRDIATRFQMPGRFESATPIGNGHIHDTYCVCCESPKTRWVLQRINHSVFRNPEMLMENVQRVTAHLARKVRGQPDADRRVLRLIPTRDGTLWHRTMNGEFWRAYNYIEGARSHERAETPRIAFEAARAFGRFQCMSGDLPEPPLRETIPDFHHTPARFQSLERAIEADAFNRAASVGSEIDFAFARKDLTHVMIDAHLPQRVTHNDTKLNNVLIDATGEGICVIDLDTVMPGLAPHDFGDLVRSATNLAREDEPDPARVTMQVPIFEAIARGYLEATAEFLSQREKQLLVAAAKVITFETGIRFLTDYLEGDSYFKVSRPGQNLDRCRAQFRLLESMEQQEETMTRIVEAIG